MKQPRTIDLRRVVISLSDALDLVGVDDVLHGKRVGMMAAQIAETLGEDPATIEEVYDAGLLHDCGVSSTRVHRCLVDSLDWPGSFEHCQRGYELLRQSDLLGHLADYILLHHWHWDQPVEADVTPEARRIANLLYLVDRVDALAAPYHAERSLLSQREAIRRRICDHSGSFFAPELVEAFLAASAPEAFWLQLDAPHVLYDAYDRGAKSHPHSMDWPQLKHLGLLFARIVDAKSPFTVEHSEGVARLSAHLGRLSGFDEEACDRLELAGLLHDIGKLRIPDDILEKHGSLTEAERRIMMSHSFETYQILRRTPGVDQIARLAAFHHERLSGDGYPFQSEGEEITPEMRIIQVADVFQALAQRRPYREPLAVAAILAELDRLVAGHGLDGQVVALVKADAAQCHRVAIGT